MWIAMNKNGSAYSFKSFPKRDNNGWIPKDNNDFYLCRFYPFMAESLGIDLSKLTWESEPVEIKMNNDAIELLKDFVDTLHKGIDFEYLSDMSKKAQEIINKNQN